MVVNELQLPLNFGLDDLYERNNNNAAFILADGKRFGASSLMLGYHSPVIKEKYIKQGILEIDADEFSFEAVKAVCEAMYCGGLDITRKSFRDVNKMCHVFQVTWMLPKCLEFFERALGDAVDGDSDADLKFLFEEAVYFSEHGRSGSLLDAWMEKSGERRYRGFTKKYLESAADISEFTLKTLIDLTNDRSVFLKNIHSRIIGTHSVLDNVSRFLLKNLNLLECFEQHPGPIVEIFNMLLDNEEAPDWRMLYNLYREVTQEYFVKQSKGKTVVPQLAVAVADQPIPNLFNKLEEIVTLGHVSVESQLEKVAAIMSSNLYMVLEYIVCSTVTVTDSVSRKLLELKRERKWDPIPCQFLDSFNSDFLSSGTRDLLRSVPNLTTDVNSVRVVSQETTDVINFFTSSAIYRFNIKLPGQAPCDKQSKCGFLIGVTGISRDNSEMFDIKLILDQQKYPEDLHCHDISADRIHLVVEYFSTYTKKWYSIPIYWEKGPVYCTSGKLTIGRFTFRTPPSCRIRPSVYVLQ